MEVKLIGLNGKARSGKDTTADFISQWCEDYNLTFAREAFARRLKESAAHALGVFSDEVDFCENLKKDGATVQVRWTTAGAGPNAVIKQVTGREYLQYYGTEAHRDVFGSDFWVDAVLPKVVNTNEWKWELWRGNFLADGEPAEVCVITDVRFPNEAERIKELGGDVWKITRDGAGAGNHASEQELSEDLIDVVIENNGTLEELQEGVGHLMEEVSGVAAAENAALGFTYGD